MAAIIIDRDLQTEKRLCDFAATLSERDRRRFAAIEAVQRGHGGMTHIASVLGISTERLSGGSRSSISWKMIQLPDGCVDRVQVEKKRSIPKRRKKKT